MNSPNHTTNHTKINIKPKNNSCKIIKSMKFFHFTKSGQIFYSFHAILNQIAERGNSNNELLANTSTPFQYRAIFVCSTSTSKENQFSQSVKMVLLSMIACNGQSLLIGCFPVEAVFHLVTSYRQAVESKAIAPNNQLLEQIAMIYKFLLLGTRLHISTYAKSEAEARQFLNLSKTQAVCFARVKGAVYA